MRRMISWKAKRTSLLKKTRSMLRLKMLMLSVTEPPKSLGPPTVVLVQRTSDNPVGAPDHWQVRYLYSLPCPRAFHPSRRHYNTSEVWKCGSSYNNLLYIKVRKSCIIIGQNEYKSAEYYYYITWEAKTPLDKQLKVFLNGGPFLPQLQSWFSSLGTTLEQKQQKFAASSPKTTWDKALSTKCTFASLNRQIKDSQGYAGLWKSR